MGHVGPNIFLLRTLDFTQNETGSQFRSFRRVTWCNFYFIRIASTLVLRVDWRRRISVEARPVGGYCSIPVRWEKSAQVNSEAVELERNWWMLDIFFKVKPVGFFDRVDVVYEKRRIKEKCNIFVLDNCKHDS